MSVEQSISYEEGPVSSADRPGLEIPSPHISPGESLVTRELIAEVAGLASRVGANGTEWPGLTAFRFDRPVPPKWESASQLAVCVVVQGRQRVHIQAADRSYGCFNYFITGRGERFKTEILEANPERPFMSFVLHVDPSVVLRVLSAMHDPSMTLLQGQSTAPPSLTVSMLDRNLMSAFLRFLRSIRGTPDRTVLSPLYLQETLYRLLQTEHFAQLVNAAKCESSGSPVSIAITYIRENISEAVTVAELAEHVSMSHSTFAHVFKDVTGMSPYQFVKRARLDRARSMLVEEGCNVSKTAKAVGYGSLSHFINEFKRHFGVTPGDYAGIQNILPLSMRGRSENQTSLEKTSQLSC